MSDYLAIAKEMRSRGEQLGFRWLEAPEVRSALDDVRRRFAGGATTLFFWEHFTDCACVQDPQPWHEPGVYPWSGPVLLIFYDGGDSIGFEVQSIRQITAMIDENQWFNEYVVCDDGRSWCFMLNHHGVLFGCGAAMRWLQERVDPV